MKENYSKYMTTAIDAVLTAGSISMKMFHKAHHIDLKKDKSLVTEVDKKCEKEMIKIIRRNHPDHDILSEEEGELDCKSCESTDYRWIIDPIDGTHNYAHGIGVYGTMVALEYKGMPIVAAIYIPFFDELFTAVKGKGAFLNGKKISVSSRHIGDSMIIHSSNFQDTPKKFLRRLNEIAKTCFRLRILGSSAYDNTRVAAGQADSVIFPFHLHRWDVSAPYLILKEAGAVITEINGKKLDLNNYKNFVASNKKVHSQVLNLLNGKKVKC